MSAIYIRGCSRDDWKGILNVCYRTGFMGNELTGTGRFDDVLLFGYLFCLYYPLYEPQNGFVAVDESTNGSIAGYIIGTADTKKQQNLYKKHMIVRIALRLIFYTWWKYSESYRAFKYFFNRTNIEDTLDEKLFDSYPAHLHINVLESYQGTGVGSRLMDAFEDNMRKHGVRGIHLKTSNMNTKAIPFYTKRGYCMEYEKDTRVWKGVDNYKTLVFTKQLD